MTASSVKVPCVVKDGWHFWITFFSLDPRVHQLHGKAWRQQQDWSHSSAIPLGKLHHWPLGLHLPQPLGSALPVGGSVQDQLHTLKKLSVQNIHFQKPSRPNRAVPNHFHLCGDHTTQQVSRSDDLMWWGQYLWTGQIYLKINMLWKTRLWLSSLIAFTFNWVR